MRSLKKQMNYAHLHEGWFFTEQENKLVIIIPKQNAILKCLDEESIYISVELSCSFK